MKTIRIGDRDYEIHYGQNAVCALEDELGDTITNLLQRFMESKVGIREVRALIWAGLLAKKRNLKPEDVGNLIDETGESVFKLSAVCVEELAGSFARMIQHEAEPEKN